MMRFPWLPSLLLGFAAIFAADLAAGRDILVNNLDGDDRNTGFQPRNTADGSGPVRTIAKALRLAGPGDRIVLAKTTEPYRESISLVGRRHSGFPRQPFTIQGNGATLDGSIPVSASAWEHYREDVFCFRPFHKGYQQLFIDDRPVVRVPLDCWGGGLPKLEPRQWYLHDGTIYFRVEQNRIPPDYNFSCAFLPTGITLLHVRHVAIVDLIVQGFQIDGINAANSARNVYLANVTCRGNGRSGITVGGASQVEIDRSLLGNNGTAQLLTLPWSHTRVRNSHLLGNTARAWVDQGGEVYLGDEAIRGGRDEIQPPEPQQNSNQQPTATDGA